MTAFAEGLIAGYGIAIPVGAIAVLLIDLALRRGFRIATAGAMGAASADLTYALVAVLLGSAVAELLGPYQEALRVVSAVILLAVAAYLLKGSLGRTPEAVEVRPGTERGWLRTYFRFLGLTILNPATVTYFVALIVGLDRGAAGAMTKAIFVVAVFLASASWQIVLVSMGAFLHKRLPPQAREVLGVIGATVVAGFALRLLLLE